MKNNRMKKNWIRAIIIVVLIVAAFLIRNSLEEKEVKKQTEAEQVKRDTDYAPAVKDDNAILAVFKEKFPEAEVVLACEDDVTNDGNKDLVVIYRLDKLTRTVVITDSGNHKDFNFSQPVPAPIENQKIQFKNIDKEEETEIIITGEKKGAVGYAIYRVINGELSDLFGEGMEDCC